MNKLLTVFRVLQSGKELADKEFWKKNQLYSVPLIAAFLMSLASLAQLFGFHTPVDQETCTWIGTLVYFAANFYLTLATSKHAGLPSFSKANNHEEPVLYGAVENPTTIIDNVVEDIKQEGLSAAQDWFKRNTQKK